MMIGYQLPGDLLLVGGGGGGQGGGQLGAHALHRPVIVKLKKIKLKEENENDK